MCRISAPRIGQPQYRFGQSVSGLQGGRDGAERRLHHLAGIAPGDPEIHHHGHIVSPGKSLEARIIQIDKLSQQYRIAALAAAETLLQPFKKSEWRSI